MEIVGYSIHTDGGGFYSKKRVKEMLLRAEPGSIIVYHMNHPEGGTAEGAIEAIPELCKRGLYLLN